jgi:hypothetical protein
MTQRIIYSQDDGTVAVIISAPEVVALLGIEAIAAKDVPHGKPYKIVDAADIPSDRSQRAAWKVDEALLTDGVGADYGAGSTNAVVGWNEDGTPVVEAQA